MYRYRHAGTLLDTALPIPELAPAADADRLHAAAWWCEPGPVPAVTGPPLRESWLPTGERLTVHRAGPGFVVAFSAGVAFHVTPPLIRWSSATPVDSTFRHLLLDQVLPLANSLRGAFGLHGSALVMNGGAVAFVGPSGAGKSTLAALLAGPDAECLADDYVALTRSSGGWLIQPSYSGSRLYADTRGLVTSRHGLRRGPVTGDKARLELPASRDAASLARVFLVTAVDASVAPVVTGAVPQDAIEMLRHVFRLDPDDRQALTLDLASAGDLVNRRLVSRLTVPRGFDRLDDVRHLVQRALSAEVSVEM